MTPSGLLRSLLDFVYFVGFVVQSFCRKEHIP
jgi:hypothetical protein